MIDAIKATLRLTILILWIALFCPLAWATKKMGYPRWRDALVLLCYRGVLWIAGIRLRISGHMADERPLLLVSNHISYLDIVLLGAAAAVRFTPKSEVAKWPVIGWICGLCDAVFVDRRPDKIREAGVAMQTALAEGHAISLFPESTTGNGLHLKPFRSGFFSLAEDKISGRELLVQPAALAYTHIRRLPIDSTQWPLLAWYGDMELMPHLWEVLKLGGIDATLTFLPPVTAAQTGDRKALAAHCQRVIAEALQNRKLYMEAGRERPGSFFKRKKARRD